MATTRPPYSAEFRAQAVDLVRKGNVPTRQVARDLGVSVWTLRGWLRRAESDAGQGNGELTVNEREELRRLRREVVILREEREILKKATAFFAKDNQTR